MKCYVINLDRSADRLKYISGRMATLGLEFERVVAVDGKQLSDNFKKANLTLGEVACFLSHRKCWESISSAEDEYAVVLEDDVIISDDGSYFLKDSNWIPRRSNIVKIETFNQNCFVNRIGKKVRGGRKVHKLSSWHSGTAAYVISKRKAKQLLLETSDGFNFPVDFYIFDRLQGKLWIGDVFQMVPAICIQSDRLDDKNALFSSIIEHTSVKPNDLKGHERNIFGKILKEASRIEMKLLNKRLKVKYK